MASKDDIQALFKETIAGFMEKGLEAELGDELSCGKYDYMTGFDAAIHAAFLQPETQNCIIH